MRIVKEEATVDVGRGNVDAEEEKDGAEEEKEEEQVRGSGRRAYWKARA